MPCSNCHRNGRSCDIDESKSKSCTECLSHKVSSEGMDIDARLLHATRETQRLEEEESKLIKEAMEMHSRLLRFWKQKNHLRKRGKELFDRGMVRHEKEVRELEAQRIAGDIPSDEEN